jgi:hypothetical protein
MSTVRHRLDELKRNTVSSNRCALTYDEYLELFVDEHVRATCVDLAQYVENTTHGGAFSFGLPNGDRGGFFLYLHDVGGLKHPLVPRNIRFNYGGEKELVCRVTSWVNWRWEIMVAFGRTQLVLEMLNEICKTPAQVRYYFPAVLTLISSEYPDLLEKTNQKPKTPPPPLPIALRHACRHASATITASTLIEPGDGSIDAPIEITVTGEYRVPDELGTLVVY